MHINAVYHQLCECFAGSSAAGHSIRHLLMPYVAHAVSVFRDWTSRPRQEGEQALENMSAGVKAAAAAVNNATFVCAHCTSLALPRHAAGRVSFTSGDAGGLCATRWCSLRTLHHYCCCASWEVVKGALLAPKIRKDRHLHHTQVCRPTTQ